MMDNRTSATGHQIRTLPRTKNQSTRPDMRETTLATPMQDTSETQSQADIDARMAERYGTNRSAWPRQLLAGSLVIGFLGVAAWVGFQVSDTPYQGVIQRWESVGTATSEQLVEVDAEVRGNFAGPLVCAIRVTEAGSADVGYAYVPFQSAPSERTFQIETLTTAASVGLLGCAENIDEMRVPPPEYPPGIAAPDTTPIFVAP